MELPNGSSKKACGKKASKVIVRGHATGFPPVPIGDGLPESTLDARETDSCWTMRSSVAFLVMQHDARVSIGTREGGGRVPECLVGAAGTWTGRGGACKGGEWRTEEERKSGADDRDRVVGSAGGGATG